MLNGICCSENQQKYFDLTFKFKSILAVWKLPEKSSNLHSIIHLYLYLFISWERGSKTLIMGNVRPLHCVVQCTPIIILFDKTEYDRKNCGNWGWCYLLPLQKTPSGIYIILQIIRKLYPIPVRNIITFIQNNSYLKHSYLGWCSCLHFVFLNKFRLLFSLCLVELFLLHKTYEIFCHFLQLYQSNGASVTLCLGLFHCHPILLLMHFTSYPKVLSHLVKTGWLWRIMSHVDLSQSDTERTTSVKSWARYAK